mgnify:CR=1 FL=1
MAIIKLIKQPAEKIIKKGLDKVFKKVYSGAEGSPFKNVDDLGSPPIFRSAKDLPGTEVKKLKMIGDKLKKSKKDKKLIDQSGKIRGGLRMGGRAEYKSGGAVCKIAKRGFGKAYGKNS